MTRTVEASGHYLRRGHHACVRALADGTVVSADFDGITQWDAATRRVLRVTTFRDGLGPVAVSLAGDVFFVRDQRIHAWRRATGAIDRLCEVGQGVVVSPDGTHVAFPEPQGVVVRRCADGQTVGTLPDPHSGGRFSLGHAGRWVLFARDETVQSGSGWTEYVVVATGTGKAVDAGQLIGDDASVGLSHDGRGVRYSGRVNGFTPIEPGATPDGPGWPWVPAWDAARVPFALAGDRALAWCGDQLLALGEDVPVVTERATLKGAALSDDGGFLALLPFREKGILVPVAQPAARRPFELAKGLYPGAIAVRTDGAVVCASYGRIDFPDGTKLPLPSKEAPAELKVSRDGRVLALRTGSGSDPRGPVFVAVDGVVVRGDPRDQRARAARSIALHPDGKLLAISTWEGLEVWEVAPHRHVRTIEADVAIALAFSNDGRRLHALFADLTVRAFPD